MLVAENKPKFLFDWRERIKILGLLFVFSSVAKKKICGKNNPTLLFLVKYAFSQLIKQIDDISKLFHAHLNTTGKVVIDQENIL